MNYCQFSGNFPVWLGNLVNLEDLRLESNLLTGNLPTELCNLKVIQLLKIQNNNLSGSYPSCYTNFCTQLNSQHFLCNTNISEGNNFSITWEEFCANTCGKCDGGNNTYGCTDPTACNYNANATCDNESCLSVCGEGVYPGDLNNDGIVNNQDVSLSGLFQYQSGTPRASSHQNTDWYPHPAQDWGILNNQDKDIKHHDCNGDGVINEADRQAVEDNMGFMWDTPPPPNPPEESDYLVLLNPIDQVIDGYIIMNIVLERRANSDLTLQGGHFTIDYSEIEGNISFVTLGFFEESWLGEREVDLWFETNEFARERKIEVGFTKKNYSNSTGSGSIGQIILAFDDSASRQAESSNISYTFEVNTIGVHQNNGDFIPIEDQQLEIIINPNNCEPNWNINEDSPFQNLYQSSNNLTTNGFVIIGEDQEVEYKANRVRINSGFSAKAGAKFKVRTGGCN